MSAAAVALALVAALVARPAVLIYPANWMFGDRPIRLWVGGARLEAPFGWRDPRRWRWRIDGFALMSQQPGTPTLLADEVVVRMPDFGRSWTERSIVLPRVDAIGFTVAVVEPRPPPPFVERDAWPLRGLVIDEGLLRGFQLVLVDTSDTSIVMDRIDGQVVDFRYDFGHREMFGRGVAKGGHVSIGPIEAFDVRASPVAFDGRTMVAIGKGHVADQPTAVLFGIDGLFRPAAAIHAEFEMVDADLRALLVEILGDKSPNVRGKVWGKAIFDSKPPEVSNLDLSFRLEGGRVTLGEDTKGIVMTALNLAPFVRMDDHDLYLGILHGRVELSDGVITLTDGRYEADRSAAQVDGRVDRESLRGRVRFSPSPASKGLSWGLLVSGSAQHPKLQLADQPVLEAWSLDGAETAQDIRADVQQGRRDRRQLWREAREAARKGDAEEGETEGLPPGLTGPVQRLP